MSQRDKAILDLSNVLNNNKSYKAVQDISVAYFDNTIDNDDPFWGELEELIVDKIIEHKQNK
jgi:hypothetical protein